MCVLILQPAGKELSRKDAEALWKANPDGGGFAFVDNNNEFLTKKFMKFEDWWQHYRGYMGHYNDRPWILHMRIATHGTIDLANVHPFPVTNTLIGGHNGIIKSVPDYEDGRSDTRVFFEEVIAHFPEDWLDREAMVSVVEDTIGHSKLAFLSTSEKLIKEYYILNEQLGDWKDGMWFSNLYGLEWGSRKKSTSSSAGWNWMPKNDYDYEVPAAVIYDSQARNGYGGGFSTGYYNMRYEQVEFFQMGNIADWLDKQNGAVVLAEALEARWVDFRYQLGLHQEVVWKAGFGAFCLRCKDKLDTQWVVCNCADLACETHGQLAILCEEEHDDNAEFPAVVDIKEPIFQEYFQGLILDFWESFDPHTPYVPDKEDEVMDETAQSS